jgi:hypothetical protein
MPVNTPPNKKAMFVSSDDDMANSVVATGALFAILRAATGQSELTSVSLPDDGPDNQIEVTLSFMKSPYRLVVEQVPDDQTDDTLTRKE